MLHPFQFHVAEPLICVVCLRCGLGKILGGLADSVKVICCLVQHVHHCRFNKVKYSVQAVHTPPHATDSTATADTLRQVEAKLLQKKTQLQSFGAEFRQACILYLTLIAIPNSKATQT